MIEVLKEVAKEAGKLLLEYRGKFERVESKTISSDVVSEADYESQKLITSKLSKSFPNVRVVGEESYSGEEIDSGEVFLVDPLDGSLNYVHGLPFYSVSIAYLRDGKVISGVVYLPETGEMFYAELGKGSYLNGERLKAGEDEFEKALIVTGWPYDRDGIRWTYRAIEKVNERVQEIRILGSCAAELSYLAAGRISGYFEIGLSPWDIAAGYLIATEAGAVVTSFSTDGMDLKKGEVVAGPESFHRELLSILREVET